MKRCSWAKHPLEIEYHDHEWCKPNFDERYLFEMLVLESAQAGLSWLTILQKRAFYRKAFHNFDVNKIYDMQVADALKVDGIVKNKLKIEAVIHNAKLIVDHDISLSKTMWDYTDGKVLKAVHQSQTPLSNQISKDLKKMGFKFVGPTIIYSYMQTIGMIDDHEASCEWCKEEAI